MGEVIEVERLDEPAASSLAKRLTDDLSARVEPHVGRACCVQVETQSASLAELLRALEEWTAQRGMPSVCVRLNGHSYILECRMTDESSRH
jgi:uncharacterized protein with PIN domain